MDPSLQEKLDAIQNPEEELEVIMRLVLANHVPQKTRIVATFGDVITCRIKRKDINEVYQSPLKFSLKAAKDFSSDTIPIISKINGDSKNSIVSQKTKADESSEVIVGVIDWGCDFTHPNFLNEDGTTRLLAIWDQSQNLKNGLPPYGYGRYYTSDEINTALKTTSPFKTLNYHPAKADAAGIGAHGTHVMDIAAGNGKIGEQGIAPNAKLAFVHLSAGDTSGTANLGDSVRILEAIDFLRTVAGDKPLVINMSVGRHGGPHDGNTLVERAIDNFLAKRTNTMLCQSTGNYHKSDTHSSGTILPGKIRTLKFNKPQEDKTPDELEIWYSGKDEFIFNLKHESSSFQVSLGNKLDIIINSELVGKIYHRRKDPVNLKNHINIFLYKNAPPGIWEIKMVGKIIADGRYHAWIERDSACKKCQAKFLEPFVCRKNTTGTICNGYNSLVAGAYDPNSPRFSLGNFSSGGPTVDGRCKPDLIAPGVKIVAAKSSNKKEASSIGKLTAMSGTSMAAPHITGTVARILSILPQGTPYYVIRNIICSSTDFISGNSEDGYRIGNGLLNTEKAMSAAKLYTKTLTHKV